MISANLINQALKKKYYQKKQEISQPPVYYEPINTAIMTFARPIDENFFEKVGKGVIFLPLLVKR
jgi:hypothetical protein